MQYLTIPAGIILKLLRNYKNTTANNVLQIIAAYRQTTLVIRDVDVNIVSRPGGIRTYCPNFRVK